MKKALHLSAKASMIDQFNISNLQILKSLGYKVGVVSDFQDPGSITKERSTELRQRLSEMDVDVYDVSIPRSLNPLGIYSAYKTIRKLFETEQFDLIHCHSPIGAAICRMAAKKERKRGAKVIYTAHGFHFYKGAPIKNWIIYYPVEKVLSKHTDVLITINVEDYNRAKKRLKTRKILYVPGVGVDTCFFSPNSGNGDKIRTELEVDSSKTLILSVGELNKNKNHESVIRGLQKTDFVYVIVGKGNQGDKLKQLAHDLGVDLRLMGFRNDIVDFYRAADVYVLPSIREGLNVSLMEAMASGVPVACSQIRGNVDLIDEALFHAKSSSEIHKAILYALDNKEDIISRNLIKVKQFDKENVDEIMKKIYADILMKDD